MFKDNFIVNTLKNIIVFLGITILLILSFLSIYKKAVFNLTYYEEVKFYYNSWKFLLLIIISILIIYLLTTYIINKIKPWTLFIFCFLVYTVLFCFLVLNVPWSMRADQKYVYDAAVNFDLGDYSSFFNGEYMFVYPHQLGLLSFERILINIFGKSLPILFSCYFVMVILINFFQWKISNIIFNKSIINNITILISFLFLPQLFLTLFIYGQIPGLLFLIISIYLMLYLWKNECTSIKKYFYYSLILLFLSISIYIRKNYSIMLVALIIVLVLLSIHNKKYKYLIMAITIVTSSYTLNNFSNNYYANKIGVDKLNKGMPNILWITMGLKENDKFPTLGGWWSGYNNWVYSTSNYNIEESQLRSKSHLKSSVRNFYSNPKYAFKFFKNKIETTWLDPYFQSVWAGPMTLFEDKKYNKITTSIYTGGKINNYVSYMLNILLIMIYFFSAVGIFIKNKYNQLDYISLYSILFFIGTFIFHLIWETKALYVYPAVYLLIPFSAYGIYNTFKNKNIIKLKR